MPMKNPPHPGLHVRHDCLEPLKLSVTRGAQVLGVTRQALNNLVNGKSGISPEISRTRWFILRSKGTISSGSFPESR